MTGSDINVLCVHQGFELYGSDRSFVAAVRAIAAKQNFHAKIILPRHGPIADLFRDIQVEPEYNDLLVLRKTDIFKTVTVNLLRSLRSVSRAVKRVKEADLTYVNTCVLVDYMLAGLITGKPMVIHVREIPTGPAMVIIRALLRLSGAHLIFNSHATQKAFGFPGSVSQTVIWNGISDPGKPKKEEYDGRRPLRVLCIGRINGWKGQDDLVEACGLLVKSGKEKLEVRIVGSVFDGQTHFLDNLKSKISSQDVSEVVALHPFTSDPGDIYTWADVVVVPSKKPEPFGRVAIEAMAYGCAVVATDHGGLAEIVADRETGFLVPPSSPPEIAHALESLLHQPRLVEAYGNSGRDRFLASFTESAVERDLLRVLEDVHSNAQKTVRNGALKGALGAKT